MKQSALVRALLLAAMAALFWGAILWNQRQATAAKAAIDSTAQAALFLNDSLWREVANRDEVILQLDSATQSTLVAADAHIRAARDLRATAARLKTERDSLTVVRDDSLTYYKTQALLASIEVDTLTLATVRYEVAIDELAEARLTADSARAEVEAQKAIETERADSNAAAIERMQDQVNELTKGHTHPTTAEAILGGTTVLAILFAILK